MQLQRLQIKKEILVHSLMLTALPSLTPETEGRQVEGTSQHLQEALCPASSKLCQQPK